MPRSQILLRGGRGDGHRRSVVALAVVLALGMGLSGFPAVHADAAINAKSKAAVAKAYNATLAPALATPTGWTGDASSCTVGSESAASKQATLAAVNFMRGLAGLSSVKLNATYNAKADQAALVYAANQNLSHQIPSSWKCYSAGAAAAAAKSNIAWSSDSSLAGAKSILGYMSDPGAGNEVVGHRRWVLYPSTTTMGTGSTNNTNDLWVIGKTSRKTPNPTWVEWPASGYFPSQLEPAGRWSLTGDNSGTFNFTKAKITVIGPGGKKLSVTKYKQDRTDLFGNDTVVFTVKGVKPPLGTSTVATYKVKVTGITRVGSKKKLSHSYKVQLFDPTH